MQMARLLFTITLMALITLSKYEAIKCRTGYFVHTPSNGELICKLCGHGTYMPEDIHNNTQCRPCTTLKEHQILVKECSSDEDAVFKCEAGYYMQNGTCEVCAVCKHEILPCQLFSDAVCCNFDNYYLDTSKVCMLRTLPCRQGKYYNTSTADCQPCPNGTFMNEDHHNNTACYPDEIADQPNIEENITTPAKEEIPCINLSASVIIDGVLCLFVVFIVFIIKSKRELLLIKFLRLKLRNSVSVVDKLLWLVLLPCVVCFIILVLYFKLGEIKIIIYLGYIVRTFTILILLAILCVLLWVVKLQSRQLDKGSIPLNIETVQGT